MTVRLAELRGLEIITERGKKIGRAEDFIIDLGSGAVMKILLEPLGRLSGEQLREFLATKSVNYSRVRNVTDIIVIADSF
ncbi:MAG: PRC-barrel domain-containing protein [Candidatus Micrarchaeota archaeon]